MPALRAPDHQPAPALLAACEAAISELTREALAEGLQALGVDQLFHEVDRQPTREARLAKLEEALSTARRAFRRHALVLHPDTNGGDPEKTDRFRFLRRILELVEQRVMLGQRRARRGDGAPGFAFSGAGAPRGEAMDGVMRAFERAEARRRRRQAESVFVQAAIRALDEARATGNGRTTVTDADGRTWQLVISEAWM